MKNPPALFDVARELLKTFKPGHIWTIREWSLWASERGGPRPLHDNMTDDEWYHTVQMLLQFRYKLNRVLRSPWMAKLGKTTYKLDKQTHGKTIKLVKDVEAIARQDVPLRTAWLRAMTEQDRELLEHARKEKLPVELRVKVEVHVQLNQAAMDQVEQITDRIIERQLEMAEMLGLPPPTRH